jgi:PRC-barrel domain protein
MLNLKQLRRVGVAAVLVSVPLLQASAQTTTPTTPQPPAPSAPPPAAKPMPPTQGQSATTPGKVDPLIGLNVLSSDGSKLGSVQRVKSTPDGKVEEIQFKTGGFLGFGGKIVAVPESKYTRKGDTIQLQMTADEVSNLPEVKDQS